MVYLAIFSLLAILAAWAQLGILGAIGIAIAIVLAWLLGFRIAAVLDEDRRARAAAEDRAIEDEAARRWAREELLREDAPAARGRERAADDA